MGRPLTKFSRLLLAVLGTCALAGCATPSSALAERQWTEQSLYYYRNAKDYFDHELYETAVSLARMSLAAYEQGGGRPFATRTSGMTIEMPGDAEQLIWAAELQMRAAKGTVQPKTCTVRDSKSGLLVHRAC